MVFDILICSLNLIYLYLLFVPRPSSKVWGNKSIPLTLCYNGNMSRKELLERRAISMARSLEVEGADFERMKKILLKNLHSKKS